jgi:hypothetical protein
VVVVHIVDEVIRIQLYRPYTPLIRKRRACCRDHLAAQHIGSLIITFEFMPEILVLLALLFLLRQFQKGIEHQSLVEEIHGIDYNVIEKSRSISCN